ncbi:hypothetical protein VFPPC_09015 [Pochonia chlamydosporia 170]|uniref:Uncharacterized protein n=1 Tax=Pochonia chlamydosporia 170 TaxID=1380566 RepID=A0A179FC21_METCM|nr:hypothetical protein VFPPC_09015 [Pochonia chlamydosporia 170]OAQ63115.1 hypothetical protein VFPPC_09015 [Pochonia chlamydosporia 170]
MSGTSSRAGERRRRRSGEAGRQDKLKGRGGGQERCRSGNRADDDARINDDCGSNINRQTTETETRRSSRQRTKRALGITKRKAKGQNRAARESALTQTQAQARRQANAQVTRSCRQRITTTSCPSRPGESRGTRNADAFSPTATVVSADKDGQAPLSCAGLGAHSTVAMCHDSNTGDASPEQSGAQGDDACLVEHVTAPQIWYATTGADAEADTEGEAEAGEDDGADIAGDGTGDEEASAGSHQPTTRSYREGSSDSSPAGGDAAERDQHSSSQTRVGVPVVSKESGAALLDVDREGSYRGVQKAKPKSDLHAALNPLDHKKAGGRRSNGHAKPALRQSKDRADQKLAVGLATAARAAEVDMQPKQKQKQTQTRAQKPEPGEARQRIPAERASRGGDGVDAAGDAAGGGKEAGRDGPETKTSGLDAAQSKDDAGLMLQLNGRDNDSGCRWEEEKASRCLHGSTCRSGAPYSHAQVHAQCTPTDMGTDMDTDMEIMMGIGTEMDMEREREKAPKVDAIRHPRAWTRCDSQSMDPESSSRCDWTKSLRNDHSGQLHVTPRASASVNALVGHVSASKSQADSSLSVSTTCQGACGAELRIIQRAIDAETSAAVHIHMQGPRLDPDSDGDASAGAGVGADTDSDTDATCTCTTTRTQSQQPLPHPQSPPPPQLPQLPPPVPSPLPQPDHQPDSIRHPSAPPAVPSQDPPQSLQPQLQLQPDPTPAPPLRSGLNPTTTGLPSQAFPQPSSSSPKAPSPSPSSHNACRGSSPTQPHSSGDCRDALAATAEHEPNWPVPSPGLATNRLRSATPSPRTIQDHQRSEASAVTERTTANEETTFLGHPSRCATSQSPGNAASAPVSTTNPPVSAPSPATSVSEAPTSQPPAVQKHNSPLEQSGALLPRGSGDHELPKTQGPSPGPQPQPQPMIDEFPEQLVLDGVSATIKLEKFDKRGFMDIYTAFVPVIPWYDYNPEDNDNPNGHAKPKFEWLPDDDDEDDDDDEQNKKQKREKKREQKMKFTQVVFAQYQLFSTSKERLSQKRFDELISLMGEWMATTFSYLDMSNGIYWDEDKEEWMSLPEGQRWPGPDAQGTL